METLHAGVLTRRRAFDLRVTLEVGRETLALVGPSGSGKTTVLRAVAGLDRPQSGRIALGDRVWFDDAGTWVPPARRDVGLVFQDYALFPHLSVRDNVAFGRGARGDELLERFGISALASARPGAISGGERQRVALARALARDPRVLLLDEPLSALDAQTRGTVRAELEDLLAELALPTIIVTHDFREAAALADRVAVLVEGRILQVAPAGELVAAPANDVVAGFTGANVLAGVATRTAHGADVLLTDGRTIRTRESARGPVAVAVHPWRIRLATERPADGQNALAETVRSVTPDGGRVRVRAGALLTEVAPQDAPPRGAEVIAVFAPEDARIVDVLAAPAASARSA